MALYTSGFIMDRYGWKVNKIAAISAEQFMVYVEIPFIALCKLGFIMDKYGWKLGLPNSESPFVHLCPLKIKLYESELPNFLSESLSYQMWHWYMVTDGQITFT